VRGGLTGAADVLTMSTTGCSCRANRSHANTIAAPSPILPDLEPDQSAKREYQRHLSERFLNWQLPISGLVGRPIELSLDDIRRLPARTQITAHVCEQGWSAIGEWTGTPLQRALDAAGGVASAARYVVVSTYDGWYEGYDLFEVAIRRRSWPTV
jgi:DMSO/TMAO reductase YedYZ molybdopterin-dependent catalytic subunit